MLTVDRPSRNLDKMAKVLIKMYDYMHNYVESNIFKNTRLVARRGTAINEMWYMVLQNYTSSAKLGLCYPKCSN